MNNKITNNESIRERFGIEKQNSAQATRILNEAVAKNLICLADPDAAHKIKRYVQAVKIEEPSVDEAVAILMALRPRLEAHHGVALEEAALRAAVEWSVRYLPDFRLPDKALDLVDQACAQVRFATLSPQKRRDRLSLPRAGTGSPSHHLVVGRDGIAAAVAAREILSG